MGPLWVKASNTIAWNDIRAVSVGAVSVPAGLGWERGRRHWSLEYDGGQGKR
ncbi:MAG: hypothetical protein U0905_06445 [Pirellulales bacterium]